MTAKQRDDLCKFIHNALSRTKGREIEIQTELVADRVDLWLDMNSLSEGIGTFRSEPDPEPVNFPMVDLKSMERIDNKPEKQGLVVLARSTADIEEAAREMSPISLSKVGPPAKRKADKPIKQWDEADLIQAINQNTPERIRFTPNGMKDSFKLTAVRDVKNLAGTETIRLEYSVGGINDTEGGVIAPESGQVPDMPVSIGLTANHLFSTYDGSQDFEAAIAGDKGVVAQLKALYAPRGEKLSPVVGPDPGPLRFDEALPMRDSYGSRMSPGLDPGNTRDRFLQEQIESNRKGTTLTT